MTLKPLTLEEYFHKIVSKEEEEPTATIGYEPSWILVPCNQPPKELTMFEVMKAKWTEFWTTRYSWMDDPVAEVEPQDYWAFYARTSAYEDVEAKETFINGEQDCTWTEIVDQILDVLGNHYGYNIKEQVYYAVDFPLNDPEFAGHGRCLNDSVLQQLLLAFPEVYERNVKFGEPKNVFE
jgi:hypothetical protein